MSANQLEAFLARLYVDVDARANFKANPRAESKKPVYPTNNAPRLKISIGSASKWPPEVSPRNAG
jgi:hypothetical protein